ncbi:MAG: amino acid ABC transporter substrate-binding protein [Spirochaetaceae bacterium]|nr:MAG: amino acid ABC transporter substrate-binding protein [Spirochaetaceae bacterium]
MLRKVLLIAVVFAMILATAAFAAGVREDTSLSPAEREALYRTPNDPRLVNPGRLTVGTGDPVYPPWMLNNDPAGGEGFENGLVYALASELGFAREDVVWVGQTFDQAIAPGPKPYDFAIQQISVTAERSQIVSFSQVYFQPDKAVVALPTSPVVGASSFAQLRNARWGATIGTTDLDYLERVLGIRNVAVYDDQAGTFQALQGGLIDATVVALPTALFATAVQVPDARITALLPADPNDRGHGLLFEKDNPLVDWVNEGLSAIIARGVIDDLIQRYLVPGGDIPEITE